jgi:hypothetical protein
MTTTSPPPGAQRIDPDELSGLSLAPQRMLEVHEAYRPILDEIRKLRELDLQPVHPAVIFEPTAVWREAAAGRRASRKKAGAK